MAFFRTEGQRLLGPDGKPFLLKGMGLGNWLLPEGYMFDFGRASSPRLINEVVCQLIGEADAAAFWDKFRARYITLDDIRFLRETGLNHVRVPFNFRLFVTDGVEPELAGPGWAHLEQLINWCRQVGLYVVFDMHGAPGGQTGDNIDDSWGYPFLFESEASQALTIAIWRKLAETYADEEIVVGYDLLNEPIANYFDQAHFNPKLEPLYKRIVGAIRKVDPNHVCFLGGAQWNTNFDVFGPPFDDNVAYTFHRYWEPVTPELIQPYIDFSKRYDVPLYMGESGENTYEWISDFRTLLEEREIGWSFWTYKRLDTERCIASIRRPEGWDVVSDFANARRSSYKELREQRPPAGVAARALAQFIENLPFEQCEVNKGYLKALGL